MLLAFAPPEHDYGDTWFHRPTTARGLGRSPASRTASGRWIPRSVGRADAKDRSRAVELHAEGRPEGGRDLELGRIQRTAPVEDDTRYSLRDHVVQVQYLVGSRVDRRHSGRRRDRTADRFHPRAFVWRLFDQRARGRPERGQGDGCASL